MTGLDELARRASRGDERALVELLERSEPDLRRFAARSCGHGADADDAVQHALTVVYTRIGTFRSAARYTTWLFTIVRRQCQRLLRHTSRWVEPIDAEIHDRSPSAPDRVDLLTTIVPAIAQLPAGLRAVLVLRDIEGHDTETTARLLGLSETNVRMRLHRAHVRLRTVLVGLDAA
jgi:RNA polymerase sigma factor (sigma-70 family)